MSSNPRLFAALTTTGLVLSLTLPANGVETVAPSVEASASVSHRVDRLKAKLRASLPLFDEAAQQNEIKNIVQFFNFSNCSRGSWTKC